MNTRLLFILLTLLFILPHKSHAVPSGAFCEMPDLGVAPEKEPDISNISQLVSTLQKYPLPWYQKIYQNHRTWKSDSVEKIPMKIAVNAEEDRQLAEDENRIYECPHCGSKKDTSCRRVCPLEDLPPAQYNYVVLGDNRIIFGRVKDSLELGVRHASLAFGVPKDGGKKRFRAVKLAGEFQLEMDGSVLVNTSSGGFMLPVVENEERFFSSKKANEKRRAKLQGRLDEAAMELFKLLSPNKNVKLIREGLTRLPPRWETIAEYCNSLSFKKRNSQLCKTNKSF